MMQFLFGLLAGLLVGLVMEWIVDWQALMPKAGLATIGAHRQPETAAQHLPSQTVSTTAPADVEADSSAHGE